MLRYAAEDHTKREKKPVRIATLNTGSLNRLTSSSGRSRLL